MSSSQSRRGSALVEFAGSLILLSIVFAGIFQTGYTFYNYNALVNAVRSGARYASLQPLGSSSTNPEFAKSVRNMVVYGEPAPAAGASPIVPSLAADNVELIVEPSAMTVSIRGFQIDALFYKLKLDGRPTVTFPCTKRGPQ